ncbi:MAG: hypothetical protein AAGA44_11110 [Pseudomonadota bacterium]
MILSDFQRRHQDGKVRLTCKVHWEDAPRDDHELFIEVDADREAMLSDTADAFLIGNLAPAAYHRERRIYVDGVVCPILLRNLETTVPYFAWNFPSHPRLELSASELDDRPVRRPSVAAQCFTGGVDSYAALIMERKYISEDDPRYTKMGILIFGLEQDDPERYQYALDDAMHAARELDLELLSVSSNIYLHYRAEDAKRNWELWLKVFMGSALAAHGHALSNGIGHLNIASSVHFVKELPPRFGVNPMIDERFEGRRLSVSHIGESFSRFEKIAMIAEHPIMMKHLRVCNQFKRFEPGRVNCGRCEKCVRTMLHLDLAESLQKTCVFGGASITPEFVESTVKIKHEFLVSIYQEIADQYNSKGQQEISDAIHRRIRAYQRSKSNLTRIRKGIRRRLPF